MLRSVARLQLYNDEQRDNDHPLGHSKTLRDALINFSVERGIGCNPERYVPALPKVFPEAELTGNSSIYNMSSDTFVMLNKTLVRSHLEYDNCVWSPYRQMDIEKNRKSTDESDQNGSTIEDILK